MFKVIFYKDKNGNEPIKELLLDLSKKAQSNKNDRIFFFYWRDNIFVLLHHFVKKSQKTPTKEIEQARINLKDFLERIDDK